MDIYIYKKEMEIAYHLSWFSWRMRESASLLCVGVNEGTDTDCLNRSGPSDNCLWHVWSLLCFPFLSFLKCDLFILLQTSVFFSINEFQWGILKQTSYFKIRIWNQDSPNSVIRLETRSFLLSFFFPFWCFDDLCICICIYLGYFF